MKSSGLDIGNQYHSADNIGVNTSKTKDGYYQFSQRSLIGNIIEDANLSDVYTEHVPAKSSFMLHAFKNSTKLDLHFNYCSIVGKLNYLAQTIRPDIKYVIHQVTKSSFCPKQEHREAICYLFRYLKQTQDIGMKFKPERFKGFEDYCDADFSGNLRTKRKLSKSEKPLES